MAAGLARRLGRRTALESVPYEIRDAQRKLTISLWFTRVALHARVHIREGGPINSKEWPPKSFYPVLRQLGIFHEPTTLPGRILTPMLHPVTLARALLRRPT